MEDIKIIYELHKTLGKYMFQNKRDLLNKLWHNLLLLNKKQNFLSSILL